MRGSGNRRTTRILATVISVLILVIAIVLMVVLYRTMHRLKAVSIVPNFTETELEPDTDYTLTIKSEPFNADIKSLNYNVDDPSADFAASVEPHKAILHTGNAGTITLYVSLDKVESDRLSFAVVDRSAASDDQMPESSADEAAVEETPEETQEETAEEKAEVRIVTVIGDNVRMRAEPNTDCEVVKTCSKGETYDLIEVSGEWYGVDNNGTECYIKAEFVEESVREPEQGEVTADSPQEPSEAGADQADAKTPDKEPEADTKIGEGMVEVMCKDGKALFTQAEYDYFVATWSYTGMADEMMTHHTADELHKLYRNTH